MREYLPRPTPRSLFLEAERRLEVYFHTTSIDKFLQARAVFGGFGLALRHYPKKADVAYDERYDRGVHALLSAAVDEVRVRLGYESVFFVEDTSLRIEFLSSPDRDHPGMRVKHWFGSPDFVQDLARLPHARAHRGATVKSDIALHIPGLGRPVFFHGETTGHIATTPPTFDEQVRWPWLTPATFNGWFIPNGSKRRLGEMSFDESWTHDFRVRALVQVVERLEEYAATLNLPPHAFTRRTRSPQSTSLTLFPHDERVLVVVGRVCAGKTTFGERVTDKYRVPTYEASGILRMMAQELDLDASDPFSLAETLLRERGADAVARRIIQIYTASGERPVVITGFRTIQELHAIRQAAQNVELVLITASERTRFQRHKDRGRQSNVRTLSEFRAMDRDQLSFGLLRVVDDFADVRVVNEGTMGDYWAQIDAVVEGRWHAGPSGVECARDTHLRRGDAQLYRCLAVLHRAGRPLQCDEIEQFTREEGRAIRHNNVNKILRAVPELAKRLEIPGYRVRYDILDSGRAYLHYVNSYVVRRAE